MTNVLVLNTRKFVPSPEQGTFFDWITNGTGSCVLEAVAGSGKTTTLVKALELMFGTIFFGAYNKKIALEIEARAPTNKIGMQISTMHSAGFGFWRKATNRVQINGDKCRDIFKAAVFRNMQYAPFQKPVLDLVSLAKQAGVGIEGFQSESQSKTWQDLIDHFDIETFNESDQTDNTELIIKLARKTLEASIQQNFKVIDFDDMIYAPLFHNCKIDKFDWVLLDEAQDTNGTRRELALRMLKDGGRMVAVGDRHQAIYGFTGADSDSLDLIWAAVSRLQLGGCALKLPLTVTYRCPKAVVTFAQQWVSHIQAHESAPEGVIRRIMGATLVDDAKIGDAILCRFNAPLVTRVYKFIAKGIPARIEGREVGTGLKKLVQRWKVKSLEQLDKKLDAYEERETLKLREKEQENQAVAVEDKVNCVRAIMERIQSIDPATKDPIGLICAEIDAIFGDAETAKDSKHVIILSSIHKSKGREWKRVFWIQTRPNGRARLAWQLEQEINLNYVAATRAQEELILVDISDDEPKK